MVFCLLFVAYHSIFYQFYPNGSGRLGHDYALAVPGFLAGYYWFQSNGIWEVPWFTPGFCGGQPFFADAQSGYYSVFQFLTLIVDPLSSLYLLMLLFAALGYWGCYFLLRRCFAVSWQSAVVAAAIFMFNGLFVAWGPSPPGSRSATRLNRIRQVRNLRRNIRQGADHARSRDGSHKAIVIRVMSVMILLSNG